MKNIIKKITLAFIAIVFALTGKAQTTCATAVSLTFPINTTVTSYTSSVYWFQVTLAAGNYNINVTTTAGSTGKITRADVYTGTCSGLDLIQTDTLTVSTDTIISISMQDTSSTTYFVKLTDIGGSTNFVMSAATQVFIVGDIGFCPGQTITLSAYELGASPPQTYTWSTGSHASSFTLTPSAGATYTLTYHDNNGTYTTTVTTFTLPPSACACQMVTNGAFESYHGASLNGSNVALVSGCTNIGNDLSSWFAATCGSPDYYNSNYPSSSAVGVPTNLYNFNPPGIYPHSGDGYAGICLKNPGVNYREYLEVQLKCPLISGQQYNVSFYAAVSGDCPNTTNSLGAYISTSSVSVTNSAPLTSYTPQIIATGPITTYTTWTQVSGIYTATGGEQYITIGNFNDDAHTQLFTGPHSSYGYSFVYMDIDDVTLNVSPSSPTLTASSCQSGSVTISAYGAPSSTLTTWAGPSSYTATGSSITVPSPTAAVTYTCAVNLSGSCTYCTNGTQTITIQPPAACSGVQPSYTITTSGTFTASPNGYILNNMTIGNGTVTPSYTISCNDVRIAAGVTITVKKNATLVIDGSWLHACNTCTNTSMWDGIFVENGGTVITQNYSIIEDAVKAIATQTATATTPIPVWNITNTIFNNNTYGMYIDQHAGDLSSNYIYGSVFTCRNIGNHACTAANFTTAVTGIIPDITATTPLIHSSLNPTDLTIAGARSAYGIYLNTAGTNTTSIAVGSGSQSSNLFDNLNYGIYNYHIGLIAKNNRFQNLTGFDPTIGTADGVGIYSENPTTPDANGAGVLLIVGNNSYSSIDNTEKNYFINCLRGVWTKNHKNAKINNNVFSVETTAANFRTGGNVSGEYAVINTAFATNASSGATEVFQFANNSSTNYQRGCWHNFLELYNTSSNSSYFYANNLTGVGTTSQYCYQGILLTQSAPAGAGAGVPQDALSITTNTITNVTNNCIEASAVNTSTATTGFVTISANTELSVKYTTVGTATTSVPIAGVFLTGCNYMKVSNNPLIGCTGMSGSYGSGLAQYLQGVYVYQSTNSRVTCNVISDVGECFVWNSTNTGGFWKENTMSNSQYGLVLRNSGTMGDQGLALQPIDDVWGNSSLSVAQTLCDASDPHTGATSKLYCRASTCTVTTTYLPCVNTAVSFGTAYSSPTTLISTTGRGPGLCTGEGGNGREMADTSGSGTQQDSVLLTLENSIANSPPLPVYDAESRWAIQYYVSSTNSSITAATGYENAKTFALIDGAIAAKDYNTAQSLLNNITTKNTVESNWKTVDNIIISKILNDTLTPSDVSLLETVAAQCPLTGGSIVWRARAIADAYHASVAEHPNDCPAINGNARTQNTTAINNTSAIQTVNLYPNPNNGSMVLDYNIKNDARLEIMDITGNLVGTYILPATGSSLQVNNDNLQNGVYLFRVICNGGVIKNGKIVIMK